MSISVGDLVKIKFSTRKLKNLVESPEGRGYIQCYSPEHRGETGLVTSIACCTDDDAMWTPTMLAILLETGESILIDESKVARISYSEKPGSLSPERMI